MAIAFVPITGCGENGSADSHLKKAAFIKAGEKICNEAENEQLERAGRYVMKHPHPEEKELVPILLPMIENEIDRLRALGVPEGDEVRVAKFLNALANAVRDAKDRPLDVLNEQRNPFKKPDRLASEYGFSVCANNP